MRIVHAVRSGTVAGVERYIADVAVELDARGHDVVVVAADLPVPLPDTVDQVRATTTLEVGRALVRVGRADVIHAHMTAAELPALLIGRAPVVCTRHFAAPRGGGPLMRLLARRLTAQIAISQFVAGAVGDPAITIPNGVISRPDRLEEPERVVLVLQRLEKEKRTAMAVEAFVRSGLADDGWRMLVGGRGSDRLPDAPGVIGLGFVQDPYQLLKTSSVFLATAEAEPFGLAVVEAMAAGVAVVAAAGGAHPETLGPEGYLFHDADEAARMLRTLAEDGALRAREGDRLQQRQRELFTVSRHVDALETVYAQAAAKT
ncbi:MAG TPA: glycosyltransferase family 4 protein [Mycobacteriales bacterium]|nr:glycosyltransferase family 4 protein [Mycobacteriales bacterium]